MPPRLSASPGSHSRRRFAFFTPPPRVFAPPPLHAAATTIHSPRPAHPLLPPALFSDPFTLYYTWVDVGTSNTSFMAALDTGCAPLAGYRETLKSISDTISVNLFLVSNLCCQSQLHHVANAFMPLNGLPNLAKSSERPEAVAMAVPELSLSSPAIDAPCMAAPSADSSAVTDAGAQSQQQSAQRKARRCWSPELHRPVRSSQHLGGPQGGCWAVR
ncbi:hypothetical protein ZWY2020_006821 [Hordeum vulgare]|nr:hypothetical protein ZWY2020_006821 [Hordeum vulgare]